MLRLLTALLAALLALTVGTAPAQAAHDEWETVNPQVNWPWSPHPDNPDQDTLKVTLAGPTDTWTMRKVARWVNEQVEGIHIYRSGWCPDRPDTRCLRVLMVNKPNADWAGLTYGVNENRRVIELNKANASTNAYREYLACHELGHALGIMHHQRRGCVQSAHSNFPHPNRYSDFEVSRLREHYNYL